MTNNFIFLLLQFEYNTYEKCWKKWRNGLIQKRVLSAMEEHETKKQLSEVWLSYNCIFIWLLQFTNPIIFLLENFIVVVYFIPAEVRPR